MSKLPRKGGAGMIDMQIHAVASGVVDARSGFINTWLQGVALGVMIERRRWESERGEQAA